MNTRVTTNAGSGTEMVRTRGITLLQHSVARGVAALFFALAVNAGAGCHGHGGENDRTMPTGTPAAPTPTAVSASPTAVATATATLQKPAASATPTARNTAAPTPAQGEGACFVGAPRCTGRATFETRDDCCEFARLYVGPEPVAWCANGDLDAETLECAVCREPCEATATPTAVATPVATPTAPASATPSAECDVTQACAEEEFCELPSGICGSALDRGSCVEVPFACFDPIAPLCGCDGRTYASECLRRAARVQKAGDAACPAQECKNACDCYATRPLVAVCPLRCANCDEFWTCEEGKCLEHCGPAPLPVCEALCASNEECADTELCSRPEGNCTGSGACSAIPEACLDIADPVCGCDGRTYGNGCVAAQARVAIDHKGACEIRCGGFEGIQCPNGEFCERPAGLCDAADAGGICVGAPAACPLIYDPVCGCDGLTYGNDCVRRGARVQLDHRGECTAAAE